EAGRRDLGSPAGVVQDADDSGWALVARGREPEPLDELRIRCASGDRARSRVRHVCKQGTEADDELDAELSEEPDHELAERAPAEVRLDPEQEHRVAIESRRPPVIEDGRRPVDPPSQPFLERYVRPRRLEVEEVLRVDLREALRVPELGEEPGRERRALTPVVPAPESRDQDRAFESRAARNPELLGHARSLGD